MMRLRPAPGELGCRRFTGGRLLFCCLLAACFMAPYLPRSRASGIGWQIVTPITPSPQPRGQYGMVSDEHGNIYLYGGNSGLFGPLGDFWKYSTATTRWQLLSSGMVPPLVEPHLAIDLQGNVWEFGGIANPGLPHLTADGHSFGLYEYQPSLGIWRDLTPSDARPGDDWPPGREDHGFAFDRHADELVAFAGEGQGNGVLNDMWTYSLSADSWTMVNQKYANSGGAAIAPREIYNVSADSLGHLYLFGGTYLTAPVAAGQNHYANDLWRYDDATHTWSLLAGHANGYDPRMPVPRHYYGQIVDGAGDFDIMGGYLNTQGVSPFFRQDTYAGYALPFQFVYNVEPGSYGLSDFWRYDPGSGWHDVTADLGALAGSPMIPYVLVFDRDANRLYTFGGYHLGSSGFMDLSNTLWSLPEDDLDGAVPTATAPPRGSASRTARPSVTATATTAAPAGASPTPES